jgi:hypothetical protein
MDPRQLIGAAERLGDEVAGHRRGAPVGELGSRRIVGAQLNERALFDAIDAAVADVERHHPLGPDADPGDGRAHAAPGRVLLHQREQFGIGIAQEGREGCFVDRFGRASRQMLGDRAARHFARGMAAHAVGHQPDQRRRDRVLEDDRRSHRLAGDPVADGDAILIAGAHRALMGERRGMQTNRRHEPPFVIVRRTQAQL